MEIVNTFEKIIDGITFVINAYSDGHVERIRKEGQENVLPKSESAVLEMQTNIQYLIDITEINMEG